MFTTATLAYAQTRHPFAVGANEGAGAATSGLLAWISTEQARFYKLLTAAVRGSQENSVALWSLAGLSFGYGVFHAAGPGHGKAVMASYMVANERALKRGLVLTFAAALLQAVVAIGLVGLLAWLFNATASKLTQASAAIETASYVLVAALGSWLVWAKGRALAATLASRGSVLALAGTGSSFVCEAVEPGHVHDASCGHFHAPDPAKLGADHSWSAALGAIAAAGLRPCSGAILVLVFALAQGVFAAGILATLAMALGTAITTGAIAALAVFAKRFSLRMLGREDRRGALLARAAEFIAALFILAVGLALLFGSAVSKNLA